MDHVFVDRAHAGRLLGRALAQRGLADAVVLALPRCGVPGNPELAVGAIAEGAAKAVVDRETLAATGNARDLGGTAGQA